MALEITHIDDIKVEGLLDGALPFHVTRNRKGITARIASWKREREDNSPKSHVTMRSAAYEMLARYRECQRLNIA